MIKLKRNFKKIFSIILAIIFVLALVFFAIQKKGKNLDYNRVALIDVVGNNYIFRGNNPFIEKNGERVFAYDELTEFFNKILRQKGGQQLPENYHLINVSLLDLDEFFSIKKEKDFFATHLENGEIMNVSTLSPSLLFQRTPDSNIITKYFTDSYALWTTNFLTQLHNLALNQMEKPVVIYIHCNGGRDRTGFMAASYRLLFHNMNLPQAVSQNIAEAGRNSENLYENAIYSYCLYIKQTRNKPDNYCIAQPKNKQDENLN